MTTYVYVAAQDDDKVSIFTMDESSGHWPCSRKWTSQEGLHCWP